MRQSNHLVFRLAIILFAFLLLACGPNLGRLLGHDDAPQDTPVAATATIAQVEAEAQQQASSSDSEEALAVTATDTEDLREAVTVEGMRRHLEKLQEIADANGNTRASGTPGYDASAAYVQAQLEAAGYEVMVQSFEFDFFEDATVLEQVEPDNSTYRYFNDFATMTFSPGGEAAAPIQPVGLRAPLRGSSDSGCREVDFVEFEPGNIALIKRGVCPFAEKAKNAQDAGASAVLIFNDAAQPQRERVVFGTLGEDGAVDIPVVGLTFALGEDLYRRSQDGEVVIHVEAEVIRDRRETVNIIADTPAGRNDFIVVVGGHLDSVPAGPGIQDNGSGVAAILETALQMAELGIEPQNKVRFAFWGAEEFGLLGSRHYLENLSRDEREQIALNLNFDMIASPNYGRFVYDGDHSEFSAAAIGAPAPDGSGAIEQVFHDYFEGQDLALAETPFDGRSDYGPFIQAGIPAGGLFTGAEETKGMAEVSLYGGVEGDSYDACYHLPCDTIDNINWQAMDEMGDAAAHAVMIFAMTDKPAE
jgi:Zn-dependent M28 family amino/carboxypeptidase